MAATDRRGCNFFGSVALCSLTSFSMRGDARLDGAAFVNYGTLIQMLKQAVFVNRNATVQFMQRSRSGESFDR
jgi:hypothetical protein